MGLVTIHHTAAISVMLLLNTVKTQSDSQSMRGGYKFAAFTLQVVPVQHTVGYFAWLKQAAKQLKRSVLALFYATQDPDVGWAPKVIAVIVLAYALSPMDLIPDFIPVLGILDDLLLLPGMIWLVCL